MISKEQWLSLSKTAINKPKGKYILTYFLGSMTKKIQSQITKIAKDNQLEIIHLADLKCKESYETGPSEFIDYIESASVFFTDSFHGVAFSILMNTPFVVYERISKSETMYSRIETLLNMFNLESREVNKINSCNQIFNMDFSGVNSVLEREREKAIVFLKESLGSIKQ